MFAGVTKEAAIVGNTVAAAFTGRLVFPVTQRHIGAIGVVGMQRPIHDQEEVTEPPGSQSHLEGNRPLSFAELIVEDMGMRRVIARRGPIR